MTSDLWIVAEPLSRTLCAACGLIRRGASASTGTSFYASVRLTCASAWRGARAVQARRCALDRAGDRAASAACARHRLRERFAAARTAYYWPDAALLGCDPSRESIAQGFGEDVRLWTGSAANLPGDVGADLVIAVNVIEHTLDPIRIPDSFARRPRARRVDGDRVSRWRPARLGSAVR